jgi:DNA topoisomerase IB
MKGDVKVGTLRIGKDLHTYQYKAGKWNKINQNFPNALKVAALFKAHNRFNDLVDQKNNFFLKGQLYQGQVQGARIITLPTGQKLDKPFSLFSPHLTIHDESSHDHWDVIYQNPNGKYAYLYTLNKKQRSIKNKYKKVELFERIYNKLQKAIINNLSNEKDNYALPMYTLMKTYMRVGNEIYFKHTGHKGLTTLKKQDIQIDKNKVQFSYIAKSGVPMQIIEEFPLDYIKRLKEKISSLKKDDFVFTNDQNKPMRDTEFMKAFQNYCGQSFYPHIIRSFYATKQAKDFLKLHKSATKQEVNQLFSQIAEKLGHKRFDKKSSEWVVSSTVTIHHYIQPELVEKIQKLTR